MSRAERPLPAIEVAHKSIQSAYTAPCPPLSGPSCLSWDGTSGRHTDQGTKCGSQPGIAIASEAIEKKRAPHSARGPQSHRQRTPSEGSNRAQFPQNMPAPLLSKAPPTCLSCLRRSLAGAGAAAAAVAASPASSSSSSSFPSSSTVAGLTQVRGKKTKGRQYDKGVLVRLLKDIKQFGPKRASPDAADAAAAPHHHLLTFVALQTPSSWRPGAGCATCGTPPERPST